MRIVVMMQCRFISAKQVVSLGTGQCPFLGGCGHGIIFIYHDTIESLEAALFWLIFTRLLSKLLAVFFHCRIDVKAVPGSRP